MSASRKKIDYAIGWTAFVASYLVVLLMMAMPLIQEQISEPHRVPSSEVSFAIEGGR